MKKKIMVVDDSSSMRMLLSNVINDNPKLSVVGTAENGQVALDKIPTLMPDLITLDIQMPVLDGLEALQEITKVHPHIPVIMVSVLTGTGADSALSALSYGACDCLEKPSFARGDSKGLENFKDELSKKILAISNSSYKSKHSNSNETSATHNKEIPSSSQNSSKKSYLRKSKPQVLAIGTSTGGPDALSHILQKLPGNFPIPILIVQHMPMGFTGKLANRLDQLSELHVKEAEEGELLSAGNIYIAPGDFHMTVEAQGAQVAIKLDQGPPQNSCRPAVDNLFESVASIYGESALGVILTGMGRDGLKGVKAMSNAGAPILVQDEESSVVWGMPGYVARAGFADKVVSLGDMSSEILFNALNYPANDNDFAGTSVECVDLPKSNQL